MQNKDISKYTFDDINSEKDPYNKCYFIYAKFKGGTVTESERSAFLDLFIESMNAEYQKNGNNSSISHLVSYIFQYLNNDEKNKLILQFIKYSETYDPKAYQGILPYCTDEQRNQIIKGKLGNSQRSAFLDSFIESMCVTDKSSISHLVSYIFQYLNDDEKNKLIPQFIKYSGTYDPKAYQGILPYCTDEQRNQIILENNCIKDALYTAYIKACTQDNYQKIEEQNYQTFRDTLALDPVFKDVIDEIAPETLQNAFIEINQVFQGQKVDYTKSQEVEKSANWQITVITIADHILKTPKQSQNHQQSFVQFIEANGKSSQLFRG